jgi:hypothetical protein
MVEKAKDGGMPAKCRVLPWTDHQVEVDFVKKFLHYQICKIY